MHVQPHFFDLFFSQIPVTASGEDGGTRTEPDNADGESQSCFLARVTPHLICVKQNIIKQG